MSENKIGWQKYEDMLEEQMQSPLFQQLYRSFQDNMLSEVGEITELEDFTEEEIEELLKSQGGQQMNHPQESFIPVDDKLIENLHKQREEMSNKHGEEYHVDHIIPLSIGGAHHQDNMRVITAKENMEKGYKYIPELGGVWADNDLAREYKKKHNIK